MQRIIINERYSVSDQITAADIAELKNLGIELIICNRPDGEEEGQPDFATIKTAAELAGIASVNIPFSKNDVTAAQVDELKSHLAQCKTIHAYCRTGNRSRIIWEKAVAALQTQATTVLSEKKTIEKSQSSDVAIYDVAIIGAGSAGICTAAGLLKRNPQLKILLIDPSQEHYYQPGWTLVGGGAYDINKTQRKTADLIPSSAEWLQNSVVDILPDSNQLVLKDGQIVQYEQLVVAPGLEIHWAGIEGLEENLGRNGITSNYHFKTAPYTFDLVQKMQAGKAIFTQPAMPIKCAGAPQKAMYLACDYWQKHGKQNSIETHFYNTGPVLFGVSDYVPALQNYIDRYNIQLHFQHELIKIDGSQKIATFKQRDGSGQESLVETNYDMLHASPPQRPPQFIRESVLSDEKGWLDVNSESLQHARYSNIWGVGDVINAPNAKTMAAVRKQSPVVAHNICRVLRGEQPEAIYDGYGSCPLTVENGKVVLAEFGYGGKLLPSFPSWLIKGTEPSTLAWWLKAYFLPEFYWHGMLKGHEWMAKPELDSARLNQSDLKKA